MGRRPAMAALALAVLTAPAEAAEVSTFPICVYDQYGCEPATAARYVAAPGEANDLSIRRPEQVMVFRDRVPIAAGSGCAAREDGSVACPALQAVVDLGDGDDVARAGPELIWAQGHTLRLEVAGGAGDDVLSGGGILSGGSGEDRLTGRSLDGGEGADVLTGTPLFDDLTGGAGADTLDGGDGGDTLDGDGRDAPPAADVLDGGRGVDTVSYGWHPGPVRIDLTTQTGADGDRLARIEEAAGGPGDDVLIGDAHKNRLDGGLGSNTILGRGGDDHLSTDGPGVIRGGAGGDWIFGGDFADVVGGGPGDDALWEIAPGADRYSAGAGDDSLLLETAIDTVLGCGPGRDSVAISGLALLPRSCELVEGSRVYPRVDRAGRLVFTINARRMPRGRIELRVRGRARSFAVTHFTGPGRDLRVRLRIPPRIRRLAGSPLPVIVRLRARDLNGGIGHKLRWVIELPR